MRIEARWDAICDFWKHQSSDEITLRQIWFDVIFGIVAPIICLILDPFIFSSSFDRSGYLKNIQIFAYCSIGLGILALSLWLVLKTKSNFLIGAISGILFTGALLAVILGVYILPWSLIGLIFVVGALGFVPFLSAFVFLRNGVRALRKIQSTISKGALVMSMLLGIALVTGMPAVLNWKTAELVSQPMYTILHSNDEKEINLAVEKLKSAFWCFDSCYDEIVRAYLTTPDITRRKYLSTVYLQITENSIAEKIKWISTEGRGPTP